MNKHYFTLPNGFHVFLEPNHSSPVVAFHIYVKVGSADESEAEAGMSHFIEHMIFKGTPTMPAGTMAKEIEAAGGDVNAYTSFDQTVYYVNMSSRFADRGFEILADAVMNPLFDADELVREREVILEEIRRGKDNPGHVVTDHLFGNAYSAHSYRRPIIGYPETLNVMTRADMQSYFERWYTAPNMGIVVVGDFEVDAMRRKIERTFSSLRSQPAPARAITRFTEPEQNTARLSLNTMNVQSSHMGLCFHIPELAHADVPALDVLSHILGGSDSSRLEQTVKEKLHLAHRISSYAYTPRDPGLFIVSAGSEDNKIAKVCSAIRTEIDRLQQEPVSQTELALAKLNIRSHELYEKETVGGQAGKHAYFMSVAENPNFEADYYTKLQEVTAADIMRVAQQYLQVEAGTLSLVSPLKSSWSKQATVLEKALKQSAFKKKTVVKKNAVGLPEVLKLKNGLTLLVQENNHLPLVTVTAAMLGGLRAENKNNNGISHLISQTITKGTSSKNYLEVIRATEKMAGHLSGFSGRNSIGLRADFVSEHLHDGFALFADVLLNPTFSTEELEKEKKLQLQALRDQEDALSQLAFVHFLQKLYPKHPYGLKLLGSEQSVKKLNSAQLQRSWKSLLNPQQMVLSIVGDIRTSEVKELVERNFSFLKAKKSQALKIKPDAASKQVIRTEAHKKDKQQAHIVYGFAGPSMYDKDYPACVVLNNILSGQGGRLFLELRDKMSLAYSVSSVLQPGIEPGYFAVYIDTDPNKVETALAGIERELEKVLQEGIAQEELDRSKQYLVGTYELDLQRNSSLASTHAFNQLYGLGVEEIKRYPEKIMKVTLNDVLKAARRLIQPSKAIIAIVRPH